MGMAVASWKFMEADFSIFIFLQPTSFRACSFLYFYIFPFLHFSNPPPSEPVHGVHYAALADKLPSTTNSRRRESSFVNCAITAHIGCLHWQNSFIQNFYTRQHLEKNTLGFGGWLSSTFENCAITGTTNWNWYWHWKKKKWTFLGCLNTQVA